MANLQPGCYSAKRRQSFRPLPHQIGRKPIALNLSGMTKKAILAELNCSLVGQVLEFLPPMVELSPADATRARLAVKLAVGIDGGGDLASAAHVKEFRAVLTDLEDSIGASDDAASDFWSRMSAEVGD